MQTLDQAGEKLNKLKSFLEDEGYTELKIIPGRGICGIYKFMYTVAIVYGIDKFDYEGRYCYPLHKTQDLILAYNIWDGKKDPLGQWIKHKGLLEYTNPNYKEL